MTLQLYLSVITMKNSANIFLTNKDVFVCVLVNITLSYIMETGIMRRLTSLGGGSKHQPLFVSEADII